MKLKRAIVVFTKEHPGFKAFSVIFRNHERELHVETGSIRYFGNGPAGMGLTIVYSGADNKEWARFDCYDDAMEHLEGTT